MPARGTERRLGSMWTRLSSLAGLVAALAFVGACGARNAYFGEVVHPAELPVRGFAPIEVAHADDPDSIFVATGLVDALVRGGTEARAASTVGTAADAGAARMRIEVLTRFRQRTEVHWTTRPENVCGPYGCYVRQVSYPYDVPIVVGEAWVRVIDVPSGRPLAERAATRELSGMDGEARRRQLRAELVATVAGWLDPRVERVRANFLRVRLDAVSRARDAARASRWDEAEAGLRGLVDSPGFANLEAPVRANVLHDLALATRFGGGVRTSPVATLERALSLAEEALRLDARGVHLTLRDELRAQLEEARVLERQSAGASAEVGAIPVPPAYGAAP